MKKILNAQTLSVLFALTAATVFTGCDNADILSNALDAVQKNDVAAFQKTSTGAAREKYGNETGLAELRQKLSGATDYKITDEKIVHTETGDQGYGQTGDVLRVYEEEVSGKQADGTVVRAFGSTISCTIKVMQQSTPQHGCPVIYNGPCTGVHYRYIEIPRCKLADLRF